jgi:hypothetical protein
VRVPAGGAGMAAGSLWRGVADKGSEFKGQESQVPLEDKDGNALCRRLG